MKNEGERTGLMGGMCTDARSPRREDLREEKDAWLAIRDIAGRELARIPVAQADGQAVWDTRAVAPGTYTVELMNAGASLSTVKLVVNP